MPPAVVARVTAATCGAAPGAGSVVTDCAVTIAAIATKITTNTVPAIVAAIRDMCPLLVQALHNRAGHDRGIYPVAV
ncbi:MAG TPA: hypothetical protein VFN57_03675 [Thermomicrobiaceae bacterium]|nr:hypothetical protein [Thermomicrobiaceae bacterium]